MQVNVILAIAISCLLVAIIGDARPAFHQLFNLLRHLTTLLHTDQGLLQHLK